MIVPVALAFVLLFDFSEYFPLKTAVERGIPVSVGLQSRPAFGSRVLPILIGFSLGRLSSEISSVAQPEP